MFWRGSSLQMTVTEPQLLAILGIGHDTSMRGEGISLRRALERTQYVATRKRFGPDDLLAVIKRHSGFVEQWIAYSEDKRTSCGWYLKRNGEIGTIRGERQVIQHDSLEEAVAEYVVRELDYWASLSP